MNPIIGIAPWVEVYRIDHAEKAGLVQLSDLKTPSGFFKLEFH